MKPKGCGKINKLGMKCGQPTSKTNMSNGLGIILCSSCQKQRGDLK